MNAEARIEAARAAYARAMFVASGSGDRAIERAFAHVGRERFLPPPPWTLYGHEAPQGTTSDPADLYRNVLVAIDARRGINNGEPSLHAAWMGSVRPRTGETVLHVGAGSGYYTALLAELVGTTGRVVAYELDPDIAEMARHNCASLVNVTVVAGSAVGVTLPAADIIYVNAAVAVPPIGWLRALLPGGRLVFPWHPAPEIGLAMKVTRHGDAFAAEIVGSAWFIPCAGASALSGLSKRPDRHGAGAVASLVPTELRQPDASAVAIGADLWFSREPVAPHRVASA
jgi:protein-L-isoaspartate(D-aspartate) O-methyltransferase